MIFAALLTLVLNANTRVAWLGCNRLEPKDWDVSHNPSSANLAQLRQSLSDLDQLSPRPEVVFLTGDLVIGYADDRGEVLKKQLDAWSDEVKRSSLYQHAKIVVLSGNHEMNIKRDDSKLPSPHTTAIWNQWIRREGWFAGVSRGPTEAEDPEDHLVDDQSWLNGSISVGRNRYILVNSDTRATKNAVGSIPLHWVEKQVRDASSDSAVENVFILAHRNLVDMKEEDAPIDRADADRLTTFLKGQPKFRGFLCSHVHLWARQQMSDHQWQIVEGRGGSKLNKAFKEPSFGFTVLDFDGSQAIATRYDRPVPEKYDGVTEPARPSFSWKL